MTDDIDKEVGVRLRAMRVRRGLPQKALGDTLGVSLQQIQKYERGVNRLSVSALVRLSRELNVNPVHFLEGL